MDVLSSQANLAGYRAVIEAAAAFQRGFPMMMTAAGTVPPARVFVIGAGVAGLQAIATARRLGAIVSATDVRPAAKEEIKSLGATFVGVEDEETAQPDRRLRRRNERRVPPEAGRADGRDGGEERHRHLHRAGDGPPRAGDRDASRWWTAMRPGSVVVDLAADAGGNCAATKPGRARRHRERRRPCSAGTTGRARIPVAATRALCPQPADLPHHLLGQGSAGPALPDDDDIVKGVLLTRGGAIVHPQFAPAAERGRLIPETSDLMTAGYTEAPDEPARLADEAHRSRRPGPGARGARDRRAGTAAPIAPPLVAPVRLPVRHLRDGLLRRLLRGVERHPGAALAADGGDQRDLLRHHRRRHAGHRPRHRRWAIARVRLHRRHPGHR